MLPRRILVVDDEAHIREIAGVSLELTRSWVVATAGSGAEAIRVAIDIRPDAILLDVMMPEIDGPTTLSLLRADARTQFIPVIFLTAKVQPAEKRRFLQLGVDGIIAKPFDPLLLADQVAATLQWS